MSLFARKSMAQLHAEAEAGTLRRALGPLNLTTLGIGAIIGAGIFVLTGQAAAQYAGPAIVISFVLAGAACLFAGLCYAEFASMIPVAGSAYTYAYATLGELLAWIIGWDLILEYALGAATVAVGWSGYVVSFLKDVGINLPAQWATSTIPAAGATPGIANIPAILIVLAVSALLVIGIKESAGANAAIVIVKLAVVLLFIAFGVSYMHPENWKPFIPPSTGVAGQYGWSGILRGAGVIFFAYIGFDAVSTAAQESKNPQRDMPIGMLLSLLICTILYIAVSLVLTGVVHYSKLNVPDPMAVGIDAAGPGLAWLRPFIKLGAIAGLSSVILVMLLGQPRIFYSMSRDGLLPPVFGKIHPKFKTPYITTIITGIVVAIAAGILPINILGELVSIGTLLAFAIVSAGVLVMRYTMPDIERPFRTPLVPLVPILGAAACLYLMAGLPWPTWERLIIWLVIGLLIYFLYGRFAAARLRATREPLTPYPGEVRGR
ncbi:MAG TPA: amino acid permease [Longimicrobiales bacterium]